MSDTLRLNNSKYQSQVFSSTVQPFKQNGGASAFTFSKYPQDVVEKVQQYLLGPSEALLDGSYGRYGPEAAGIWQSDKSWLLEGAPSMGFAGVQTLVNRFLLLSNSSSAEAMFDAMCAASSSDDQIAADVRLLVNLALQTLVGPFYLQSLEYMLPLNGGRNYLFSAISLRETCTAADAVARAAGQEAACCLGLRALLAPELSALPPLPVATPMPMPPFVASYFYAAMQVSLVSCMLFALFLVPCLPRSTFVSHLVRTQSYLGIFFIIVYLFPVAMLIRSVVVMKETRRKENLLMMGVHASTELWSHILTYVIIFSLVAVLLSVIAAVSFFPNSNWFILFLLFELFGISGTAFATAIAVPFDRSITAALVGVVIFFAAFFVFYGVNTLDSTQGAKVGASILSPVAFAQGLSQVSAWESDGIGSNFNNLASINQNEFTTVAASLLMMCLDSVVCEFVFCVRFLLLFVVVHAQPSSPLTSSDLQTIQTSLRRST